MNSCTNFFNSGVLYTPERELECTFTYKDRLPYSEKMQQGRRGSKEDETSEAAKATPNKTATPLTPRTPVNCMAPHSTFDMTPLKSPARVYTPRYMDADLTPQKTIRRSNMQSQRQTPMTFNLKVMNMSLEGATNMKHQNVSALNVSLDPVNTSTVHQTVLHGVNVERDYFPPSRNPFSKFRMYETPYTLGQDYLSKENPNDVLPLRADAAIVLSEQTLLQPKCNPLQTQIQCHPNCSEPAYSNQTFSEERNTRNSSSISGGSPGKCAEVLFGKREHDTSEKHSPLDTEYGISQSPSAARDTKSSSFPMPAVDLWGRRWSDFSDGVQSRTLDEYSAILAHPPGSVVKQKQNSPFSTETELRFMDSNTPSTPAISPDDVKNRTGESTSSDDRRPHEAAVLSKPLFSSFEDDEEEGKQKALHLSKPPMWSPATASARHYASAPVAKHLVPNLEKYPNSSDNTFIEEEILFLPPAPVSGPRRVRRTFTVQSGRLPSRSPG
ncbi:hypothetical protein ADEAN_000144000 [Angomonas deanei]|uniref:Uncharacterized protein n=1 Tax=Angomonas deanei TaxID=59799 RepID=A0A7G2C2V6_9TRYP|nr:hypothetical protein ADEAN_000144000 [Angomonas deanei]